MRATHWLIGCALCIAGIGSAAATSMDTQEMDSSPHAVTDNAGAHESGGGDALGLNRDCPPASNSETPGGSTSASGNDHTGGASSTPTPTHRPHLGWQSLLPGSIQ